MLAKLIIISNFIFICVFAVNAMNDTTKVSTRGTSTISHGYERVLLRRKRYLFFPKGSAVALTISMVKGLLFQAPKGYNFVGEVDYFYTLPENLDSLRPKKKHLKPAITTTTPPLPEFIYDDHHNHVQFSHELDHPDIFVPESGWQENPTNNIFTTFSSKERVGHNYFRPKDNSRASGQSKTNKRVGSKWNSVPAESVSYADYSKQRVHYKPRSRYIKDKQSPVLSNWEDHQDWKHFEGHRTRRDLYQSLEKMITGIDLQPCLLRTICEAQHFLLPKGKSLFHDIFRILFTLPIKDEFKDSYSHAMRAGSEDCLQKYHNDCPISILAIVMNHGRSI